MNKWESLKAFIKKEEEDPLNSNPEYALLDRFLEEVKKLEKEDDTLVILREKNGVPTKIKFNGREYALLLPNAFKGKKPKGDK